MWGIILIHVKPSYNLFQTKIFVLDFRLMNGNNLSITLHGVHELISTARRAKGDDVGRVLTELQLKRKIIEGALIKNLVSSSHPLH